MIFIAFGWMVRPWILGCAISWIRRILTKQGRLVEIGKLSAMIGQFANFHKPTLFGKNAPDPTDGTTKYPRPYHPTECDKYHEILSAYFKQHKIKDQLQNMISILEKYEPGKAPMEVIKKVNAIERKRTELMKSAARQCHNVKKGGKYPYSPKLVTAAQPVLYWKERLSCHRNEVPMPADKDLFRIMYEITDTAGDHRLLIEQQLSRAFTNLRKVQGNSIQLRNEFLKLLAQDRANRLGTDSTVEIENIKRSEESKRLAWFSPQPFLETSFLGWDLDV